jgi:GTPase SAR1 family protein
VEDESFSQAVKEGAGPLNSCRLCLVGQGRAGKTALANALIDREFKPTDSTIGVSQRFLEVDKVDLTAGESDSCQWKMLGEDKRFIMSRDQALALQAAKIKLKEANISVPEEKQGIENIADLLTGEELETASPEGDRDVSARDTINTLDCKTSFAGHSSAAFAAEQVFQSESKDKTPQKKDAYFSKEKIIKDMNMELSYLRAGRKEPLRISLWDYGGQDKFIGMHHLYLSRYCVYLLVFNMKWLLPDACEKGECLEYLTAWINSIAMHTVDYKSQAPILIIGTHKDKVPSPDDHANISKILDDKFENHPAWEHVKIFNNAQGKEGRGIRLSFFPVDNTCGHKDDVLKQMQSEVLKVLESEEYVKLKVPNTWLGAYEALQKETKPFLEFEKVKDICFENGMGTDRELNHDTIIMLKYFHHMGLIMYHDEKALKHLVILDPARFLVEPVSRVVCQHDIDESASFAPTEERHLLIRTLKSRKPHQWEDLRKGILHREILREILWSDIADNRDELELLMTKYQFMVPLRIEDENEDRFLVPGLLPEQQTNHVDDHPDKPSRLPPRLVGYFIFGHTDRIKTYRKGPGYVSVDSIKKIGFLPKGLFAAVLGSIVAECELVHDMSFSDMEVTLSSISTGFGSHKFVLRQLPEYNMMELVLMVDSHLLVVERLLECMQRAVSKLMPSLRFAICIDQEGGVCRNGRVKTLIGTEYLVILDGDVKNDGKNSLDGENSLEQRLGADEDKKIQVAPDKPLSKIEARNTFSKWLVPKELSKDYHVFLSYRRGDFDTELVQALYSNLCTAVSEQGRQVHVFLDQYCLQEGRRISSDFAKALKHSLVVVPVVSYAALLHMFDLKPDSDINNVLLEWMLIVELLERGHLKFWYPIMVGEVKEDAENGKFILDLDSCIDKLPEVVCNNVACRVNDLLVKELGMEPSESVHTYTVRGVVKKIISDNLGFSAWEMNALPMKRQQSKLHLRRDWKKGLYKFAADKVLNCVEKARQARQEEEEEAAAARAREEAARRERGGVAESTNSATNRDLPRIEGFFCKINPDQEKLRSTIKSVRNAGASDKDEMLKELDALDALVSDTVESIDPIKEAQKLTELLEKSNNRRVFEVKFYPQPTFKCFSDSMRTAAERNVRHLLFSGHYESESGFFWLKEGAFEYDRIPTEDFLGLFDTEVAGAYGRGTIEGVVLNACKTEDLGKKLIAKGVQHVVCWRSDAYDSKASAFSCEFYTSFEENKDYRISFQQAVSRIFPGKGATSSQKKQRHLHPDAVNYVCLLSKDGENEFPDTGHIRGRVEDGVGDTQTLSVEIDDDAQGGLQGSDDDGDIVRNWRPPKYPTDYGAQAGQAERECLELLGFQMTLPGDASPICVGKGIEPNGFIKDSRVFAMWGVRNYTSDVWGSTKKAVQEAKKLLSSPAGKIKVSQAIEKLKDVEYYRKKDMEKHGGVCGAHAHPLKEIEATRKELEDLTSPLNSLGALVLPAAAATRSAPEPAARTQPPPPSTPSTRAPTALDEANDDECKTDVSLSSSGNLDDLVATTVYAKALDEARGPRKEEEARQKAEADQKAAEQAAGKYLLPFEEHVFRMSLNWH